MKTRTFTIAPGTAETLGYDTLTALQFFMTDAADVVWLMAEPGDLDIDRAIRLDKAQCPMSTPWRGPLFIHSPAQGQRTVQVSVLEVPS